MASTTEAGRLTEAHRLAQARLGAETVEQLLEVWPLLDPADIDTTTARWLRIAIRVVTAQRRRSALLAANYLSTFRAIELGVTATPIAPVIADTIITEQVATSLTVTGPYQLKKSMGLKIPEPTAVSRAQASSARAGMRHSLNGGRDTIIDTVTADKRALGWARTTSGKPCAFCAMLASRGPVYKTKAGARFRAHDDCHCGVEPVYHTNAEWPAGGRRYHEIWQESTRSLEPGDTALNAFRRALANT